MHEHQYRPVLTLYLKTAALAALLVLGACDNGPGSAQTPDQTPATTTEDADTDNADAGNNEGAPLPSADNDAADNDTSPQADIYMGDMVLGDPSARVTVIEYPRQ